MKFAPRSFRLNTEETEDVNYGDAEVKANARFTPVKKPSDLPAIEDNKLTAVVIKNLPASIPESEIREYLFQQGLQLTEGILKISYNDKKNTQVDVENLEAKTCRLLVQNIHEKMFNDRKVYCRAVLEIETPKKVLGTAHEDAADDIANISNIPVSPLPVLISSEQKSTEKIIQDNKKNESSKSNIPGLTQEEIKKSEKKQRQKNKKEEKRKEAELKKKEESKKEDQKNLGATTKETGKVKPNKKTEVKDTILDEFEFHDTPLEESLYAENSSDVSGSGKGFASNPPLETEHSPKTTALLTPTPFSSRSAKQIQKEEL